MPTPRKFSAHGERPQQHPNTPCHEISPGDIPSPIILIYRDFRESRRHYFSEVESVFTKS